MAAIVSTHDAKLESDRNALRTLETETEQLQSALLQFSEATEKSEGLGELLKERSRHLQTNQEQLKVTLAAE